MKSLLKSIFALLIISLLGGILISSMGYVVMGNSFGFENVSPFHVIPGFLVGSIPSYFIAFLFRRNRQHFLARLKAEQEISKRLSAQIAINDKNDTLETWLSAIFDHSPIEIVLKDTEGKIVSVSQNVADQSGLAREDYIGRTTADFLDIAYARKYMDADREVIKTKSLKQQEVLEETDGIKRYLLNTKYPVWDNNKKIIGLCSITSDITDLKVADEISRTALKEAEKANQAKSEFLATMSHELRTPLNAIRGFSQMLTLQIFGPLGAEKYLEYAHDIRSSSEHLLNLINDLLDLSSIEAGKKSLKLEEMSLRDIIDDCVRNIADAAAQKNINLSIDIPDTSACVLADRRAFKQILINLLSNAVKFTPNGGEVFVNAENQAGSSLLEIRDNGPGIPSDMLSKLGEPFYRTNDSYLIAKEGTGLGLTIVKSLIELHNGSINIESDINYGTTVSVNIPNDSFN